MLGRFFARGYWLKYWCCGLFVLVFSAVVQAEIFKCVTDGGQTEFSDKPCAPDAEKITVDTGNTGANLGSQGDYSKVEGSNDLLALDKQIQALDKKLNRMQNDFDRKYGALRKEFNESPNTSIGLMRKETLLIEIDNLRMQHEPKAEQVATMLGILKGKRDAILRRDMVTPR